jgi:hypothetical protein
MRITYTNKYSRRDKRLITTELVSYIADALDDSESADCVDRARKTGRNAGEALGRLVEILICNKALAAEDITYIAGTEYSHENIKIEDKP